MTAHFKHGDRVTWNFAYIYNKSARRNVQRSGTFIRKVEGENRFGDVFVLIDGNKNPSKIHQHELELELETINN